MMILYAADKPKQYYSEKNAVSKQRREKIENAKHILPADSPQSIESKAL